jgi:hypothetical protein
MANRKQNAVSTPALLHAYSVEVRELAEALGAPGGMTRQGLCGLTTKTEEGTNRMVRAYLDLVGKNLEAWDEDVWPRRNLRIWARKFPSGTNTRR